MLTKLLLLPVAQLGRTDQYSNRVVKRHHLGHHLELTERRRELEEHLGNHQELEGHQEIHREVVEHHRELVELQENHLAAEERRRELEVHQELEEHLELEEHQEAEEHHREQVAARRLELVEYQRPDLAPEVEVERKLVWPMRPILLR